MPEVENMDADNSRASMGDFRLSAAGGTGNDERFNTEWTNTTIRKVPDNERDTMTTVMPRDTVASIMPTRDSEIQKLNDVAEQQEEEEEEDQSRLDKLLNEDPNMVRMSKRHVSVMSGGSMQRVDDNVSAYSSGNNIKRFDSQSMASGNDSESDIRRIDNSDTQSMLSMGSGTSFVRIVNESEDGEN
jgi:hypothetical protein